MKIFKFIIFLVLSLSLIFVLDRPWKIGSTSIPPLGQFLNPFGGFWQNADEEALNIKTNLQLDGLQAPVTVVYDSNYVPHIYAENNEDLFYAQGYVMAQNRLWQMEFQIMAASGRISEILGENENYLNFDRLQRRKGMVYGANRSTEKMSQDTELLKYAEAYSRGVNAYIDQLSYSDMPVEYKLLNYKPEPWDISKSALILEYMIQTLTEREHDLENTNFLTLFGKDTFNLLFPERIPNIEPTVPTDEEWDFKPLELPMPDTAYPNVLSYNIFEKPHENVGSNNWAISPEKSATGNAIMASDPHLGLNLPSLWMMMHLNSPDFNVYGFTFPGAMGITMGFNDSISWAFTNAPRDLRDWYAIEFKDETRQEYLYDSGYRETTQTIEEIKVKGGETYYDTVIYTHHGPIVYDESFTGAEQDLALRWVGHEPSMVQKALLMLNRGNNYEDYREALVYWEQPPQNAVFASVQGDIGITVAGKYPLKWREQGKFILEGKNPLHEWKGFIPMEHNAFQHNPERGFVSSANQHSVDEDYPYWFYNTTNEFYRNRRINSLLRDMDSITVEQVKDMQLDDYAIKAEEILPLLLDTINTKTLKGPEADVLNLLKEWDYTYDADKEAPLYFNQWFSAFQELLWDELDREEVLRFPESSVTIHLVTSGEIGNFTDIVKQPGYDSLKDVVTLAFKRAIKDINSWSKRTGKDIKWGNYKGTSITHLARLQPFSATNINTSGNGDAINATTSGHGPSFRMVVELSSPPKAWGIYPGGQSGNPGSRAYDNMVEEWRTGQYRRLLFPQNKEEAESTAAKVQTLKPVTE